MSSAFSLIFSPIRRAATRIVNPDIPVNMIELFKWFLYPKVIAKILIGIVKSRIILWTSSLSIVIAKELYESTIKAGANKQCIRQSIENDIANLSDSICDFMLNSQYFPKLKINVAWGNINLPI